LSLSQLAQSVLFLAVVSHVKKYGDHIDDVIKKIASTQLLQVNISLSKYFGLTDF
jgi:hypothetical protein